MALFNEFLLQLMQPYFFYPMVFLSMSFIYVLVFLKLNPMSHMKQSILWLIPLLVPALALFAFFPKTLITVPLHLQPPQLFSVPASFKGMMSSGVVLGKPPLTTMLSITGLLCLGGAIAALGYFVFTIVLGPRAALRAFHVIMMSPDDYPNLQDSVKEAARKMGVTSPKVGLTDDLRPNAFTVGYGKNATLVFSLGLLNILDANELTAVVSHELAHIKARDYLFRSLSYALNLLSFFNPLSYFAASQAQKGRELLADERGAALLAQPNLLAHVLEKIDKVTRVFPKEGFTVKLSSGLFLVSPLTRRLEILAAHPKLAHRIQSINAVPSRPAQGMRQKTMALLLVLFFVGTAAVAGYSMVQLQNSFLQKGNPFVIDTGNGNPLTTIRYGAYYPANVTFPNQFAMHVYGYLTPGPLLMNWSETSVTINGSGTLQIVNFNESSYQIGIDG